MKVLQFLFVAGLFLVNPQLWAEEKSSDVILFDGPEVDLTLFDVQQAFRALSRADRIAIFSNPQKLRTAIDSTYLAKVAEHRALAKGLDKKPDVQARLENRRRNVLAEAEVQDQIEAKIQSLDEAAQEYYMLHRDEFQVPEMVRASHILLKKTGDEDYPALLARIRKIQKSIQAGELTFYEAAKKYSEDSSAPKGGDLGAFSKGRMVKPFEDAAFSLKPGEMSEPVKTRFGYHLIRVEERIPAKQRPYEKVKKGIIEKLKQKKAAQIKEDYLLQIRDDPRIKVNQADLDEFMKHPRIQ